MRPRTRSAVSSVADGIRYDVDLSTFEETAPMSTATGSSSNPISASVARRTTHVDVDDVVRVELHAIDGNHVEVLLPGTTYRLRLVSVTPVETLRSALGRRIRGRIEGRALRMHVASAGGRFIEPAEGMPRIVQGSVQVIDRAARRMLVDMSVPVWVHPMPEQDIESIAVGDLVNFYMESGTQFSAVGSGT